MGEPRNKKWTEAERSHLRRLYEQGFNDDEVAEVLQRSQRSVANQRYMLGLTKPRLVKARSGSVRDYSDPTLLRELRRRGYTCWMYGDAQIGWSDELLLAELRRRGYRGDLTRDDD